MKVVTTPYGYKRNNIELINKVLESKGRLNDKSYKIMIGHSSFKFLNHIKIMEMLKKYKNENIIISLVLAYGDEDYTNEVEEYAINLFGDKVEIIKEYMSYEEYIEYLNTVDTCILDYTHQAALGNIFLLLYLGKKLYLNKDGLIRTALMLEGIETYNINNIINMNFKEFSAPLEDASYGINYATKILDEITSIKLWRNTLKDLEY